MSEDPFAVLGEELRMVHARLAGVDSRRLFRVFYAWLAVDDRDLPLPEALVTGCGLHAHLGRARDLASELLAELGLPVPEAPDLAATSTGGSDLEAELRLARAAFDSMDLDSLTRAATGVLDAPLNGTDGTPYQILFWRVALLRSCIETAHRSAIELMLLASEVRRTVTVVFSANAEAALVEVASRLWEVELREAAVGDRGIVFRELDATRALFSELCWKLADCVTSRGSLDLQAGDLLVITTDELQAAIRTVWPNQAVDVTVIAESAAGRVYLEIRTRLSGKPVWATLELPPAGSSVWFIAGLYLDREGTPLQ